VPSGRAASAAGGDIRVALFISARGTVPAVTMESGSGLSVAVQAGGPAVGTAPGKPVRFTPAGYSLIVRETPDRAAALAAYEAAAPHGLPVAACRIRKPGGRGGRRRPAARRFRRPRRCRSAIRVRRHIRVRRRGGGAAKPSAAAGDSRLAGRPSGRGRIRNAFRLV